ncbi:MAG: hypothetical protein V8Q55_03880 [Christensenellales bacterium]
MKKATVSILALVLVVSLSLVAFVACNPKDSKKASNAEVLGTTVAVMASQMTGGATTAADDKADATFNAGVNLDVSNGASLSFGSELVAAGIGKALQPAIQSMVDKLDTVLNDNGIKVEKVDSNDAEYTEKYSISYTYVDEKTGKETTRELALYVKLSEGAELEGKKDYTFEAKVTYVKKATAEGEEDKEYAVTSFKGSATFDKAKDTTIFTLGASAGDDSTANAFANVKAYATAQGTVKIEMGAGAGISETLGASAGLSVEVGKLADGKYGAVVTANGSASVTGVASVDFVATINVYANSQENAGEFVLNGNVKATVSALGVTYQGTANLTGKAVYDATKDEAVVGLNGTINFQKVENQNK